MTQPTLPAQDAPHVPRPTLGIAIVGLGGAVGTTVAAGLALLRAGGARDGLPLADVAGLVPYGEIAVGGWDLSGDDLLKAAQVHGVLERDQLDDVAGVLAEVRPWPGVGSPEWCRNVGGDNTSAATGLRAQVEGVRADLRRFAAETGAERLVVINLASTERIPDLAAPALADREGFERGLDGDDPAISPAMVYAYASIVEGVPFGNFTPSVAADVPALTQLATELGVPVGGKDGKTGQTLIKTVLAPAFRSRALHVEGWYSTNILGNRDGLALDDPASLASKLGTKTTVLDSMLGYPVPDHVVRIDYYRPRGDAKEAWDNIDLVGFLGQRMQIKVNLLARDSVLAAPLAIEIARCLDLASRRGDGGVREELGWFFKAPMTPAGSDGSPGTVEHALHRQEARLFAWLGAA